jgi:hypothetical protein
MGNDSRDSIFRATNKTPSVEYHEQMTDEDRIRYYMIHYDYGMRMQFDFLASHPHLQDEAANLPILLRKLSDMLVCMSRDLERKTEEPDFKICLQ